MSVTRDHFLEKLAEIETEKPRYRLGGDGSDGSCDCIGLIIGALRRAGGEWRHTHGSNYAYRYETAEGRTFDGANARPGDLVFKCRRPGDDRYALPASYRKDRDLTDYYHVGVVLSVQPLQILHCSVNGVMRDQTKGAWTVTARLKQLTEPAEEALPELSELLALSERMTVLLRHLTEGGGA